MMVMGVLFALLGVQLLLGIQSFDTTTPAELWFVLWVPAGIAMFIIGAFGLIPPSTLYPIIPAILGAGAVARAVTFWVDGRPVGITVYLIIAALIGPAWNAAVPVREVFRVRDERVSERRE